MSSSSVTSSIPQCTICGSSTSSRSRRSIAKLVCGHVFHLDCIGTQFNFHDIMECPNCNHIENGNWRFAAGDVEENNDHVEMHPNPTQPQYNMQRGFPNLPPRMMRNPQPTAPRSFHPAVVPGIPQLSQYGLASQPQYVPASSSLPFPIAIRTTLGYPIHPNLPYHNYNPAPGGYVNVGPSNQARYQAYQPSFNQVHPQVPYTNQAHLVRPYSSINQARHQVLQPSTSQARHQARPLRNGWRVVQNVHVPQQQQPSASAAAQAPFHLQARGPISHIHRGMGTYMGQGAQPLFFYNQGRRTRHPFQRIMGYYPNMMPGHGPQPLQNQNDEGDIPTMHRFL